RWRSVRLARAIACRTAVSTDSGDDPTTSVTLYVWFTAPHPHCRSTASRYPCAPRRAAGRTLPPLRDDVGHVPLRRATGSGRGGLVPPAMSRRAGADRSTTPPLTSSATATVAMSVHDGPLKDAGRKSPAGPAARRPYEPPSGAGAGGLGEDRLAKVRGQAGTVAVDVLGEPVVGHVHLGQTAVDLVRALVEPPADLLPVFLGQVHGGRAVRRHPAGHRLGQPPVHAVGLVLEP